MAGDDHQIRRLRHAGVGRVVRRNAVTMVEILVVVVIIGVLLGAVLTASSTLITRAHTTATEAVLTVVHEALVEFEREQTSNATLAKSSAYKRRYGLFPPDELEVFTDAGVPNGPGGSRAPGQAVMVPPAPYQPMQFFADPTNPQQVALEHRDLAAMVLAIELFGDSSRLILDKIPDKNRTPGIVDEQGTPLSFLDADDDGNFSGGDRQIRFIVDDWGQPLGYFAQRDWTAESALQTASSNHDEWNRVSAKLVQLNRGRPLLLSYGPDGAEQLTRDAMEEDEEASLVGDFAADNIVDNPFNADNVFLNRELKEKLLQGVR